MGLTLKHDLANRIKLELGHSHGAFCVEKRGGVAALADGFVRGAIALFVPAPDATAVRRRRAPNHSRDAVDLKGGFIAISAEVSKIREPRKITIQPNLAASLRAYPPEKFPLVVGNFQQRCSALRKKFSLSHDVMRHTFNSVFVAKFRSSGEAAIQAGNSESIIRKYHLDMKTRRNQHLNETRGRPPTPCFQREFGDPD